MNKANPKGTKAKKLIGTPVIVLMWLLVAYLGIQVFSVTPGGGSKEFTSRVTADKKKMTVAFLLSLPVAVFLTKGKAKQDEIK